MQTKTFILYAINHDWWFDSTNIYIYIYNTDKLQMK